VTAHLTLSQSNAQDAAATLQKLAGLGVGSLSLSSSDPALNDLFEELQDQAASLGLALSFDLPVPYSADNPVALATQADEVPSGAGRTWLYVEPDGDVLPAQGMMDQLLGNILHDEWGRIYPQREPAKG
jgi:MoaA/NifB/PqqE/SkfB family radical SAM enzyme